MSVIIEKLEVFICQASVIQYFGLGKNVVCVLIGLRLLTVTIIALLGATLTPQHTQSSDPSSDPRRQMAKLTECPSKTDEVAPSWPGFFPYQIWLVAMVYNLLLLAMHCRQEMFCSGTMIVG